MNSLDSDEITFISNLILKEQKKARKRFLKVRTNDDAYILDTCEQILCKFQRQRAVLLNGD